LVYHVVGMAHLPKKWEMDRNLTWLTHRKKTKKLSLRTKPAQKGNSSFEAPPKWLFLKPIQGTCHGWFERRSIWQSTGSSPPCTYCRSAGSGTKSMPEIWWIW
jgi:hypothetical protein